MSNCTVGDHEPTALTIFASEGVAAAVVVRINRDGSIERGPGFTTDDEASLAFWRAVELNAPINRKVEP